MDGLSAEQCRWALRTIFQCESLPQAGDAVDWRRELRVTFRRRVYNAHPDRALLLGRCEDELIRECQEVNLAYSMLQSVTDIGALLSSDIPVGSDTGEAPRPDPFVPSENAPPDGPQPAHDRFFQGKMPDHSMRFGEFLFYSGRISWRILIDALSWQARIRPRIGRLAIAAGYLVNRDVTRIVADRRRQASQVPFGEMARRRGLLTSFQLMVLLGRQKRMHRPIGEFFIERGLIDRQELSHMLSLHHLHSSVR